MQVQVFLEAGVPPAELSELGELAEALGVQTLWASSFPARREPFLCLSALAAQTGRMRLGVVPISPYEMHPLKITDSLLTLNEMCAGRAAITIGGMGHSVMRVVELEPMRRVRAVAECVEIIKAAATGEFINYRGEIYSLLNYQADWLQAPPPFVYVGANGPMMLKMAGRVADGVMLSDVPLLRMPEVRAHIGAGREAAGRTDPIRVTNFFAWHIKQDREAAIAEARTELIWRGLLQQWHTEPFLGEEDALFVETRREAFLQAFLQRTPVIEGVPEEIVASLVDNLTFTGGPEDIPAVAEKLRALADAGQDEVTLKVHGDAAEAIRLIGEQLIPLLNQRQA
jgi:5,10-methylenetetrahydromethanopterin reductase